MNPSLNPGQKSFLLSLARNAIVARVKSQSINLPECEDSRLQENQGCFVTILQEGNLRGCIGNFLSEKPLYQEVASMAQTAAVQDPRFYPMQEEDLEDFSLEISVLSPLQQVEEVEEIEVGTHGIYLEKGFARGVLLPQVATSHKWDRRTFLEQTAVKAGLEPDDWDANETTLYRFSAEIFGEDDH